MSRPMKPLDTSTQAGRIIRKFGGVTKFWEALQRFECDRRAIPSDPVILYRWTYPVSKRGTGGLIPAAVIPVVLAAAAAEGIELTPEDWYPDVAIEEPRA